MGPGSRCARPGRRFSTRTENQPAAVGTDRWFALPVPACYLQGTLQLQRVEPSARGPVGGQQGRGETGARSHRAALAQHVERDAMALDRRWNPAIERDQQKDVANFVRRAAVGERAVDVDAKLV